MPKHQSRFSNQASLRQCWAKWGLFSFYLWAISSWLRTAADGDTVLFLCSTLHGGKVNIAILKRCVVSATVFQLTWQQTKCKQCSAATGKFFCAFHYTDGHREDQSVIKPSADTTAGEALQISHVQSESCLFFYFCHVMSLPYAKDIHIFSQSTLSIVAYYRKQMTCINNSIGLTPSIMFRWSLLSRPPRPFSGALWPAIRLCSCFSGTGAGRRGQGWGGGGS